MTTTQKAKVDFQFDLTGESSSNVTDKLVAIALVYASDKSTRLLWKSEFLKKGVFGHVIRSGEAFTLFLGTEAKDQELALQVLKCRRGEVTSQTVVVEVPAEAEPGLYYIRVLATYLNSENRPIWKRTIETISTIRVIKGAKKNTQVQQAASQLQELDKVAAEFESALNDYLSKVHFENEQLISVRNIEIKGKQETAKGALVELETLLQKRWVSSDDVHVFGKVKSDIDELFARIQNSSEEARRLLKKYNAVLIKLELLMKAVPESFKPEIEKTLGFGPVTHEKFKSQVEKYFVYIADKDDRRRKEIQALETTVKQSLKDGSVEARASLLHRLEFIVSFTKQMDYYVLQIQELVQKMRNVKPHDSI